MRLRSAASSTTSAVHGVVTPPRISSTSGCALARSPQPRPGRPMRTYALPSTSTTHILVSYGEPASSCVRSTATSVCSPAMYVPSPSKKNADRAISSSRRSMRRILARGRARFDAADRCAPRSGKLDQTLRLEAPMPALDPDDLSGRDPRFIRDVGQPFCDWLRRRYFRSEIEGLEHVPRSGSFIAVANHSGGPMLPDVWLMVSYFWELFGIDAPSYALVHEAAFRVPRVRDFLIKIGALRASRRNAEKVLEAGGVLLITPGGELEALRSFWRRNQLELDGRSAFVEWGFRFGVPVLPVVNVGAHEVYFTLFSSRGLARYTGLERLTRVRTVPLNLGLPWGLWLTGFLPYLPLPAKISFMVAEPVRFPKHDELAVNLDAIQLNFARIAAT